jgi:serine phosphatase RsbU (regulator of sigma subunit)
MSKSQTHSHWWHEDVSHLASQLSSGVLNEMKRRILSSNIQKEKLKLGESSHRMRQFFQREIQRYNNRKQKQSRKLQEAEQLQKRLEASQRAMTKILKCNLSLAKKCRKNNIGIEKVSIVGSAFSYC